MPSPKIILGAMALLLALGGAFVFGPLGPGSAYHRFMAKDPAYYAQVAHACEAVLRQHPIGSSALQPYAGPIGSFTLPPHDPSLPALIRALHPDTIILSSNRLYVGFGTGRVGWGIIWAQNEDQTNSWSLDTNANGVQKTLYAESRP